MSAQQSKALSFPLILVDGSSYLYRAFHALPPLSTSQGEPTGAVRGVISMLRKLMTDYHPTYMAVVFDAKGRTFRDELYEAYKAHRPAMPDDLQLQIEPTHELIKAMGIPLLMIDGVEADDVIGTLARQAAAKKVNTLISTGDKDLAQLVCPYVTLINTMNNLVLNSQTVKEKFGVTPEQIVDYLALVGDSVDNIPGVPGVGPKTAVKWLQEFGSLDQLVQQADKVTGKVGDNLRLHLLELPLSRQLATIKLDVKLPHSFDALRLAEPQREKLTELYSRLEFKGWLTELQQNATTPSPDIEVSVTNKGQYECVTTSADLDKWIKRLESADYFAFDTETTSLDYMQADLVGISVSIKADEAAYFPCGHSGLGATTQLSRDELIKKFKPLLEDTKPRIIGQNIKYDMNVLARYGIEVKAIAFDTMLESYVLNSVASRHDMDSLAMKYLNHKTIKFTDVAGKGAKQITFDQVALEQATEYAAEDADVTLRLHQTLWPELQQHASLKRVYQELELPLVPVLSRIERNGALVSAELLRQQSQELSVRLVELEKHAYELGGECFNLGSPKQLLEILYYKLKLPILKKTPTGQPSTAEEVLQELALDYPLPKVVLECRSLSKLKSTYTDKLPTQIDPHTGRIHTSYHQAVTATGRLSSSDPNLQNIPIRTAEGRRIRQAFIAPEGHKLIAADYSQIELRIMAHLSEDKGLLKAFTEELDIHKATAAEVFNVPFNQVTADQRRSAKAINFGLIYGMSAFGLSRQLGVDRKSAQTYMDTYFARYPSVLDYMERARQQAHKEGYVETLLGRRLYLPEIRDRNKARQQAAERAAINAPMQGTAADIIKSAMIKIDSWLQESQLQARMIMQVHDELVLEVVTHQVEAVVAQVRKLMMQAFDLHVPLVVDIGVGNNWDEAH